MNALQQMPIVMETTLQTRVFDRVHELGAKHALSAYDAAYLEIGLRNGIPLATLDDKLRDAAEASGAGIFAPE